MDTSHLVSGVPSNGLRSQQNLIPFQPIYPPDENQAIFKSPRVPFMNTLDALPCTPFEVFKQNNKELELLTEKAMSPRAIYHYVRKKPELFSPRRTKKCQDSEISGKSLVLLNSEKENASLSSMAA